AGGAFIGTAVSGVWFNRILAAIMAGVLALMLSEKAQKAAVGPVAEG
ncbi:MAG: sulfite exporter TauE/SafE family protein, partial [Alphaproteobacteria bacterium]